MKDTAAAPPRMPGRRNPEPTEQERDREYRMHEKREGGEKVAGAEADFLDEMGAHGQVAGEREARREHEPTS